MSLKNIVLFRNGFLNLILTRKLEALGKRQKKQAK